MNQKVKPDSMMIVCLAIAPQVDHGMISVKIQTISQIYRKDFDIELEILVIVLSVGDIF